MRALVGLICFLTVCSPFLQQQAQAAGILKGTIEVHSYAGYAPGSSYMKINGDTVSRRQTYGSPWPSGHWAWWSRGLNFVVINPLDGRIIAKETFDTYIETRESIRLAEFLDRLPKGCLVAVYAVDDAGHRLTATARDALRRSIDVKHINNLAFHYSYCAIGLHKMRLLSEQAPLYKTGLTCAIDLGDITLGTHGHMHYYKTAMAGPRPQLQYFPGLTTSDLSGYDRHWHASYEHSLLSSVVQSQYGAPSRHLEFRDGLRSPSINIFPSGTPGATYELWFTLRSFPQGDYWHGLVSQMASWSNWWSKIIVHGRVRWLRAYARPYDYNTLIALGQSYHLVSTIDTASGLLSVYLNGRLVGTQSGCLLFPWNRWEDTRLGHDYGFRWGADWDISAFTFSHNVLTADDVKRRYEAGHLGPHCSADLYYHNFGGAPPGLTDDDVDVKVQTVPGGLEVVFDIRADAKGRVLVAKAPFRADLVESIEQFAESQFGMPTDDAKEWWTKWIAEGLVLLDRSPCTYRYTAKLDPAKDGHCTPVTGSAKKPGAESHYKCRYEVIQAFPSSSIALKRTRATSKSVIVEVITYPGGQGPKSSVVRVICGYQWPYVICTIDGVKNVDASKVDIVSSEGGWLKGTSCSILPRSPWTGLNRFKCDVSPNLAEDKARTATTRITFDTANAAVAPGFCGPAIPPNDCHAPVTVQWTATATSPDRYYFYWNNVVITAECSDSEGNPRLMNRTQTMTIGFGPIQPGPVTINNITLLNTGNDVSADVINTPDFGWTCAAANPLTYYQECTFQPGALLKPGVDNRLYESPAHFKIKASVTWTPIADGTFTAQTQEFSRRQQFSMLQEAVDEFVAIGEIGGPNVTYTESGEDVDTGASVPPLAVNGSLFRNDSKSETEVVGFFAFNATEIAAYTKPKGLARLHLVLIAAAASVCVLAVVGAAVAWIVTRPTPGGATTTAAASSGTNDDIPVSNDNEEGDCDVQAVSHTDFGEAPSTADPVIGVQQMNKLSPEKQDELRRFFAALEAQQPSGETV